MALKIQISSLWNDHCFLFSRQKCQKLYSVGVIFDAKIQIFRFRKVQIFEFSRQKYQKLYLLALIFGAKIQINIADNIAKWYFLRNFGPKFSVQWMQLKMNFRWFGNSKKCMVQNYFVSMTVLVTSLHMLAGKVTLTDSHLFSQASS